MYARCWSCGLTNRNEGAPPVVCGFCGWDFPKPGHVYPRTFAQGTGGGVRHRNHHPVGDDG